MPGTGSGLRDRAPLRRFALLLVLAVATFPHAVLAVDGEGNDAWQHRINVYLWMAGLDGTSGNSLQAGDGVSSDLTWQMYGFVAYRPTPKWKVYGGYRHMKFDDESNNQAKFFYDMAVGGPG